MLEGRRGNWDKMPKKCQNKLAQRTELVVGDQHFVFLPPFHIIAFNVIANMCLIVFSYFFLKIQIEHYDITNFLPVLRQKYTDFW